MGISELHEFHFIMDKNMKNDLKNLEMYEETGSLSGIIVKILRLIGPVVKREHGWGEQRKSRYLPVSDDPDEVRENVHVYFPGEVYRELKLMHSDLNAYSIAQLVRGFLKLFLGLVKEYGDKVFQELKRLFKQWNEENEETRLTPREFIRQLYKIIRHFPDQSGLINIYNRQFSPFWVFCL